MTLKSRNSSIRHFVADFEILVAALLEAKLDGALRGEGSFTVFVQNDDAFAALLGETGMTSESLLVLEGLSDILLYTTLTPYEVFPQDILEAVPFEVIDSVLLLPETK